ncbi:hypothetical protein ANCCAN_03544 [Ancylostoma caninum]|uniref:Uncharacterized protein n=1 Tax=Ancylostoma caninum TaxID=29170 RepID=A0A368H127_ANCCA|nr:hypothetical protein ANCCAN_03544 [Ancylostoma caninum]
MSDLLAKVGNKMSEMEQKLAEVLHLGGGNEVLVFPLMYYARVLIVVLSVKSADPHRYEKRKSSIRS